MTFPKGYAPGWSDLAIPVSDRERRRARSSAKLRSPKAWVDEQRHRAAKFRKTARDAEASVAAATAGKAGAKLSKEERLIRRATMGWTLAEQARIEEVGYNRYLDEQLDYEAIDDSALEDALASGLPSLAMTPSQLIQNYENEPFLPVYELIVAAFLRAVYSPRQLFERMTIFWSDHFNIHIFAGFGYLLKPTDDREVTRRHALGTFPELLSASAHSPAMLSYLTNDSNVRGHPNENYARELMELHTLGVDGGYTEEDVKEVARCFTGWTFFGRFGDLGAFRFSNVDHDRGKKRVLGHKIRSGGGIEDGEKVLEILSEHPNTAQFLAEKLLRYFWGYKPKGNAIDKVADAYVQSGGDIREMLRVVLSKGRMRKAPEKIKRPQYLFASTLRALFADVDDLGPVLEQLRGAGHLPFDWPAPNGYPDSEAYWSGFVLSRWNFAATLFAGGRRGGIQIGDLVSPNWKPKRIVDTLDAYLLNGRMTADTRKAIEKFLGKGKRDERRLADAIGLAVASPEFQQY